MTTEDGTARLATHEEPPASTSMRSRPPPRSARPFDPGLDGYLRWRVQDRVNGSGARDPPTDQATSAGPASAGSGRVADPTDQSRPAHRSRFRRDICGRQVAHDDADTANPSSGRGKHFTRAINHFRNALLAADDDGNDPLRAANVLATSLSGCSCSAVGLALVRT
jgi:hypothetical protein